MKHFFPKSLGKKGYDSGGNFFGKGRKVITDFIDKYIPDDTRGTCLEIGCVPGSYLGHMAAKGYTNWEEIIACIISAIAPPCPRPQLP